MKILVFEFFTAFPHSGFVLTDKAYREAHMMVSVLCRDLASLPDVELTVLRNATLPDFDVPVSVLRVGDGEDWRELLNEAMEECDAFWPIVPETFGHLEQFSYLCESKGKLLLNSSVSAVAVAASKRATFEHLCKHGTRCIYTTPVKYKPHPSGRVVVKPDDGFSSGMIKAFSASADIPSDIPENHIVQPYIEGDPASLSIVASPSQRCIVAINRQIVEDNGDELRLRACGVNAYAHLGQRRFAPIVEKICEAIPGLLGFFGVDVILQGEETTVVEVNPRLTFPYIKVSDSIGVNVAALVLRAVRNEYIASPNLENAKQFIIS